MQKIIKEIKYYNCGYCINNLKLIFKKHKKEIKKFPAGVFLIKHPKDGYILFDTGYSTEIYNLGWKGKLYNLFNPTYVKENEQINIQLEKDGIKCNEIKYLILSHLHPDHIGCVKYFNQAKIIVSEEAFNTYKKNKIRYLIFDKLLPEWFENNLIIINENNLKKNKNKYFSYYDLFNDNSMLLTKVNGHAKGQICCLIENKLFLGADSSWGNSFVGRAEDFRFFPRLIQSDMNDYIKNDKLLKIMQKNGIILCFSHDTYDKEVIQL